MSCFFTINRPFMVCRIYTLRIPYSKTQHRYQWWWFTYSSMKFLKKSFRITDDRQVFSPLSLTDEKCPGSPLRSVVRAFLPNEQRTTVQVQPGKTLREALFKALKLRKLSHNACVVYRGKEKVSILTNWVTDSIIYRISKHKRDQT